MCVQGWCHRNVGMVPTIRHVEICHRGHVSAESVVVSYHGYVWWGSIVRHVETCHRGHVDKDAP